jgi:ribosomal protein L11 methyltransferase
MALPQPVRQNPKVVLVWRKITSSRLIDAWEERLSFAGLENLVITNFGGSNRVRLELYNLSRRQGSVLAKRYGGEVRNLTRSTADWARPLVHRRPIAIRGKLQIVNPETQDSAPSHYPQVVIPAGLAFGTGEHITTASCLRQLCDFAPSKPGWKLLDVGSGTGVLAIAGAKLGAGRVVALDFDSTAVRTGQENARVNAVPQFRSIEADILRWQTDEHFQIVCANLFSDILEEGMPTIWRCLARPGHLIASGILRDQANPVLASIRQQGGRICRIVSRGKWTTIVAVKREREMTRMQESRSRRRTRRTERIGDLECACPPALSKGAERQEQTEWSRSTLIKSAGGQAHSKLPKPLSPPATPGLLRSSFATLSRLILEEDVSAR